MACTYNATQAGGMDKSLSTKMFVDDECRKNFDKSSNQEPALLSTVLPSNGHAKGDLKKQANSNMPKFGWDKFTCTSAEEDSSAVLGRTQMHVGIKQDIFSSSTSCKDVWNMAISGDRTEDVNAPGEAGGWPSWGTVSKHSKGDPSKSKGWTSRNLGNKTSENWGWIKFAPENDQGNKGNVEYCAALNNRNHRRYGQHPSRCTMSNERGWKEFEDHSTKKQTSGCCESFKRQDLGGWNQSKPNLYQDENIKVTTGCPRWDEAASKENSQWPSNSTRKNGWNESQGWTVPDCGDSNVGSGCNNSDFDRSDDTWKQHSTIMPNERGWKDFEDHSTKKQTIGCCESFNRRELDGWNQSKPNIYQDENMKVTSGCPRWNEAASKESSQWPSNSIRKDGWNESQGWTAPECGDSNVGSGCNNPDFDRSDDTWKQHSKIMPPKCDWKRSVSLTASKDCDSVDIDERNHKRQRQQPSSSTMPSEKDWNDTEDNNAKRQNSGWGESFTNKNVDGLRQSSSNICVVDQGISSSSARWEAGDTKETDGWPSWDGAVSQKSWQPSTVSRKAGWNESQRCNAPEIFYSCNENSYRKPNLDGNGKTWMQHSPMNSPKCYWKKSASQTASKGYSIDKDQRQRNKWRQHTSSSFKSPKRDWRNFKDRSSNRSSGWSEPFIRKDLDEWKKCGPKTCFVNQGSLSNCGQWIDGDTKKKVTTNGWSSWDEAAPKKNWQFPCSPSRKGNSNESWGWTASESGDFGDGNSCRNPDIVQRDDPWIRHSSKASPNRDWKKSSSFIASKGDYVDRDCRKSGQCLDQNGYAPTKQHNPTLARKSDQMPNAGRKWLQRSRNRTPSPVWNHGQHLWNQGNKRAAAVPRSRHRFGDRFRWYSGDDTAEFVDNKGVQYLGRDKVHASMEHATLEDDTDGIRNETIESTAKTSESIADDWKRQNNSNTCEKRIQNVGLPTENQNVPPCDSTIQLDQIMQLNSQFPRPQSSTPGDTKHQPVILHGSNHEQVALLTEDSSKRNENLNGTSPPKRLVPESITNEPSDAYQSSKDSKFTHPETTCVQANVDGKSFGNNGEGFDVKVRTFKFALAEFVKEIVKPFWKEGRLSKEAHKIVVKKVVDKVTGVLGTNIPVTQKSIELYLSFSKDKLIKLAQAYIEMVVNS